MNTETHNYRKDQHERTSYRHSYEHHERHLNVGYIRCKTSDQRRRAEFVYVRKRKTLDVPEHIATKVFGKPRRRLRAEFSAEHPSDKGNNRRADHKTTVQNHSVNIRTASAGRLNALTEAENKKGYQNLHRRLDHHTQHGEYRYGFVFPQTFR